MQQLAQKNFDGKVIENRPSTIRGLHWIFENLIIYTSTDIEEGYHACLSMHNRQGKRGVGRRMGHWLGVYFGEVPAFITDHNNPASWRILYEWITIDSKVEKRKKLKRFFRKHPQVKRDLMRWPIRSINGDVVRDKGGRSKMTSKLRPLEKY